VCTPAFEGRPFTSVVHNYKLTVASQSPLKVVLNRYDRGDVNCTGRITGVEKLSYTSVPSTPSTSSSPTCLADPLHKSLFYALRAGGAPFSRVAQSQPSFSGYVLVNLGACSGTTPSTAVYEADVYKAGACVGNSGYYDGGFKSGFLKASLSADKSSYTIATYSDPACKNKASSYGIYENVPFNSCFNNIIFTTFSTTIPSASVFLRGNDVPAGGVVTTTTDYASATDCAAGNGNWKTFGYYAVDSNCVNSGQGFYEKLTCPVAAGSLVRKTFYSTSTCSGAPAANSGGSTSQEVTGCSYHSLNNVYQRVAVYSSGGTKC